MFDFLLIELTWDENSYYWQGTLFLHCIIGSELWFVQPDKPLQKLGLTLRDIVYLRAQASQPQISPLEWVNKCKQSKTVSDF